jgi:hypothetical protein
MRMSTYDIIGFENDCGSDENEHICKKCVIEGEFWFNIEDSLKYETGHVEYLYFCNACGSLLIRAPIITPAIIQT